MILPDLTEHLATYVDNDPDAFLFLGPKGGFLRGGNFRRASNWRQALAEMGLPGLHFHDLRHTGNTFAAQSGASLADLKARMGHDSDRAALIYQHATRGADRRIAQALDARIKPNDRTTAQAPNCTNTPVHDRIRGCCCWWSQGDSNS